MKKVIKKKEKFIETPGGFIKNPEKYQHRLLIATPSTGNFRAEWVYARYAQTIPTNWSALTVTQFMTSLIPMEYQVADAYNLIIKSALESKVEWLLTIESDNVLPLDAFIRINEYMREGKVPVVGGVYFTKSVPAEPLIYRGEGNGYFDKWKLGDKVWCTGLPMGFTLFHMSIIREMWKDSSEYITGGTTTRRVFETPNRVLFDPEKGGWVSETGTQDLAWCKRVRDGHYFKKAGWDKYETMENPYLVDTNIFIRHITPEGTQYPLAIPEQYIGGKDYEPQERF